MEDLFDPILEAVSRAASGANGNFRLGYVGRVGIALAIHRYITVYQLSGMYQRAESRSWRNVPEGFMMGALVSIGNAEASLERRLYTNLFGYFELVIEVYGYLTNNYPTGETAPRLLNSVK